MSVQGNMFQNNSLSNLVANAPKRIVQAIQNASAKTGVDFAYLMEKAAAESSFNPQAKAKTSSATGLFQFIESTWMSMVKNHGHKYGLGEFADKIDTNGRVNDRAARKDILELRKDPQVASYMAAEFAAQNKARLERTVGGDIGKTELYFAHFMGAGGAGAFLKELEENPLSRGVDIFPREARANRGVFFDQQTGQPRTLQQIYDFFDKKFDDMPVAMPKETTTTIAAVANDTLQDTEVHVEKLATTMGIAVPPRQQQPVYISSIRTTESLAAMLSEDQIPRIETPTRTKNFNTRGVQPLAHAGRSALSAETLLFFGTYNS